MRQHQPPVHHHRQEETEILSPITVLARSRSKSESDTIKPTLRDSIAITRVTKLAVEPEDLV